MTVSPAQLQQLYLAYFGRPADFGGIDFYTTGDWDIWQVARAFSASPESQALYGTVFSDSVINAIYNNLFHRDAEPAGLLYWSQQVSSGVLTPGEVALAILLGAQNGDVASVTDKLEVANAFEGKLDTAEEITAYAGDKAAGIVRTFMGTVTSDHATVTTAIANLDALIASLLPPAPPAPAPAPPPSGGGGGGGGGGGSGSGGGGGGPGHGGGGTPPPPPPAVDATSSFVYHQGPAGTTPAGQPVTVGDLVLDHVTVAIGANTVATVSISNTAYASQAAASVGSIALGHVSVSAATSATVDLWVANHANGLGMATVGDITVSGITLDAATGAAVNCTIDSTAYARSGGLASVGDVAIGDVSFTGPGTHALYVRDKAQDVTSGDSTSGNLSVGVVSILETSATGSQGAEFSNRAITDVGNATVGSITMGDIDLATGNMAGLIVISNSADVHHTGAASAGSLTIGNLTVDAGGSGWDTTIIELDATSGDSAGLGGSVTGGSLTTGAISMTIASGTNQVELRALARQDGSGSASADVADISVASVAMQDVAATGSGAGELDVQHQAFVQAGHATCGNITIGTMDINAGGVAQTAAVHSIFISNSATAAVGAASVGTISIGNITAFTGAAGLVQMEVDNHALGGGLGAASGAVTIGNIAMTGTASSELRFVVTNYVNEGSSVGGVTVGNVSLNADVLTGAAEFNASLVAPGGTGLVDIAGIQVQAQHVGVYLNNTASASNAAGPTTIGDVSLAGGNAAAGPNHIEALGATGVADMTIGAVDLLANTNDFLSLAIGNDAASGPRGLLTVGNISLGLLDSGTNAAAGASAELAIRSNGAGTGDIVTGNITLASYGPTTNAAMATAMHASVSIASTSGTVTVGDITIFSGGYQGANLANTDNFGDLSSWFHASGTSVTIGDVDYSVYRGDAVIDVGAYLGARTIKGGQGANTVVDNADMNTIDLTASGAQVDRVYFVNSQAAVNDSGTAGSGGGVVTAAQAGIDMVTGAGVGDLISLWDATSGTSDAIDGSGGALIASGAGYSYADFLAGAEIAITQSNAAFYAAVVTDSVTLLKTTYVALNNSGVVAQIVGIAGDHDMTIATGTLQLIS